MIIISNLLPIDLKAIELSAQRYLSFDKSHLTPSSLKAIGTFLPDLKSTNSRDSFTRFHSARHPPWNVPTLGYLSTNTVPQKYPADKETVNIYTEAVKINNKVAVAIICNSSVETIFSQAVNLSVNTTTTQAELIGLKLALKYVRETHFKNCDIYTISSLAVSSCTSEEKITKTASQCRQLLYDSNHKTSLHLIKTF
jgi:hypothetical protein